MVARGIQCVDKHPSGNGYQLQLWVEPRAEQKLCFVSGSRKYAPVCVFVIVSIQTGELLSVIMLQMKQPALLISILLFTCLAANAKPAVKPKQEAGLVMFQKYKLFGKSIKQYITRSNFRWSAEDLGLNIVMSKPEWQVMMFNVRTRRYIKLPVEKFRAPFHSNVLIYLDNAPSKLPLKSTRVLMLWGLKVRHFSAFNIKSLTSGRKLYSAELYVTDDLIVNENVKKMLGKMYSCEKFNGIPLRFAYKNKVDSGSGKVPFETLAVKRAMIPDSVFAIPRGLKLSKSENEVYSNRAGEEALYWMIK